MTTAGLFLFNTDVSGNQTPDKELVLRILAGDPREFAVLMRRHNQRLYRVCRSVVADDAEAERSLEDAYLRAYRNLEQFAGRTDFAAWLTKIAIYEALARRYAATGLRPKLVSRDSQEQPKERDSVRLLEQAIDALPPNFRSVFVLRQLERMSAKETAECLLLDSRIVEARLLRSKAMLGERLRPLLLDQLAENVFRFKGIRSSELARRVMEKISQREDQRRFAPGPQVTGR